MINELSQYDIGIAIKQKWARKYWNLTILEHMETKEIYNYVIDIIKW
jgi:hypothetical protein